MWPVHVDSNIQNRTQTILIQLQSGSLLAERRQCPVDPLHYPTRYFAAGNHTNMESTQKRHQATFRSKDKGFWRVREVAAFLLCPTELESDWSEAESKGGHYSHPSSLLRGAVRHFAWARWQSRLIAVPSVAQDPIFGTDTGSVVQVTCKLSQNSSSATAFPLVWPQTW